MAKSQEKIVIIDGNALVHRAFHALPPTMSTKDGQVVNAVYGFTLTLLKVLKDIKPDYLAVTFDLAGGTFRDEIYEGYKATRTKQADELYEQFPIVKDVVEAFNIPIYEKQGFEADDVIATIVRHKDVEKIKSIIVTGDMDTLQLVDENTEVFTMRGGMTDTVTYDIKAVKERFDGLTPEQMVDYKALRGDPSDNIPGVRGIGEKGAINLLKDFQTLENIYKNLDSDKIKERYRKLLKEGKKDAMMSKKLATMKDDVKINFKLKDAKVEGYDIGEVMPLLQELEFKSLINKLPKELQRGTVPGQGSLFSNTAEKTSVGSKHPGYQLITDKNFEDFLKNLKKQKTFAVDTETNGLDPFNDKLLGISFSWKKGEAYYLPAEKKWLEKVKPTLENKDVEKIGHNIKFDQEVLGTAGIDLQGVTIDTMIVSYLINPGSRQHNLDGLVFTELGYEMQSITELIGKGKNQITLEEVDLQRVSDYACEDADYTLQLSEALMKQLKKSENRDLLEKIEMPLIPVLAEMERNGILLDTAFLKNLGTDVNKEIKSVEAKIFKLAGMEFNIASPLQLKEVLFEKMGISTDGIAKTKTGISTAASELEKLKDEHEIVQHIMRYRELAKLSSTYIEALPKLVDLNGRVHTSYNQTIAATGRLSSTEPNLQNIPIRTKLGQQIRKAFVAPAGYKLLAADYSQIELRVIASIANDKSMIESFKKGEDIHKATAAEIHGVPLEKVTKEMRYAAKAINFGIIYGQGPVGLSMTAGISRGDASAFIDAYFAAHQNIQRYLADTKRSAADHGYVETLFGRKRYLPEINSGIQQVRAGAERAAINHPIQGTAADLLKLAMIEIHKKLPKISKKAKMLLQVHDELVFEVPNDEIEEVAAFVKKEMETVHKLSAPIEVDIAAGKNWGELKSLG